MEEADVAVVSSTNSTLKSIRMKKLINIDTGIRIFGALVQNPLQGMESGVIYLYGFLDKPIFFFHFTPQVIRIIREAHKSLRF